jgi:hypothetical protein
LKSAVTLRPTQQRPQSPMPPLSQRRPTNHESLLSNHPFIRQHFKFSIELLKNFRGRVAA